MTEYIPEAFFPVGDQLPREDKPVLVIRKSDYAGCEFEVLTAKYMPSYRPKNPWQTLGNDAVTDSGSEVLGWRSADAWFGFTS